MVRFQSTIALCHELYRSGDARREKLRAELASKDYVLAKKEGLSGGCSLSFVCTSCLVIGEKEERSCQYHTCYPREIGAQKSFVNYFIWLVCRWLWRLFSRIKTNGWQRSCYSSIY